MLQFSPQTFMYILITRLHGPCTFQNTDLSRRENNMHAWLNSKIDYIRKAIAYFLLLGQLCE